MLSELNRSISFQFSTVELSGPRCLLCMLFHMPTIARHIAHRTVTLVQIEEELQHRLGNDPGVFHNDAAGREIVIRERQVKEPGDKFGRAFVLLAGIFPGQSRVAA